MSREFDAFSLDGIEHMQGTGVGIREEKKENFAQALATPTAERVPAQRKVRLSPGLLTRVDLISTRTVAALGRSCSRSQLRLFFTSHMPPLAVILGSGAANPGSTTASWLNGGRRPGLRE